MYLLWSICNARQRWIESLRQTEQKNMPRISNQTKRSLYGVSINKVHSLVMFNNRDPYGLTPSLRSECDCPSDVRGRLSMKSRDFMFAGFVFRTLRFAHMQVHEHSIWYLIPTNPDLDAPWVVYEQSPCQVLYPYALMLDHSAKQIALIHDLLWSDHIATLSRLHIWFRIWPSGNTNFSSYGLSSFTSHRYFLPAAATLALKTGLLTSILTW